MFYVVKPDATKDSITFTHACHHLRYALNEVIANYDKGYRINEAVIDGNGEDMSNTIVYVNMYRSEQQGKTREKLKRIKSNINKEPEELSLPLRATNLEFFLEKVIGLHKQGYMVGKIDTDYDADGYLATIKMLPKQVKARNSRGYRETFMQSFTKPSL